MARKLRDRAQRLRGSGDGGVAYSSAKSVVETEVDEDAKAMARFDALLAESKDGADKK